MRLSQLPPKKPLRCDYCHKPALVCKDDVRYCYVHIPDDLEA
jgi:hypothetical protein